VLLAASRAGGEQFTKITSGSPVNDTGHTFTVCWVDYDADGWLDLFVGNWNVVNCIYHNDGDGTFTKVTTAPMASDYGALAASWADYDGDGDLDVYMANAPQGPSGLRNAYYLNDGDGTFTEVTTGALVNDAFMSISTSCADYDLDGDLDIYCANHAPPSDPGGVDNQLFRNDPSGFTETPPDSTGLDATDRGCCLWADYDNDGDQDLFVAGAMKASAVFENDGDGTFTWVTSGVLASDSGSVCFSWADYDNDLDLDAFVSYQDDSSNVLYRNLGGGTFEKVTGQCVVTDGGRSGCTSWGDYDNDGDLDLFVSNQAYYTPRSDFLYENDGSGNFTRVLDEPMVTDSTASTGCAWGDYDNDGALDLYVCNCWNGTEKNSLYRNNGNANNWLVVKCVGEPLNTAAVGARVYVKAVIWGSPVWQMREVSGQSSYHAQMSLSCHFGLGDAAAVDSLRIVWPDGSVEAATAVTANQHLMITQGCAGLERRGDAGDILNGFALCGLFPNPVSGETRIEYALSHDAAVSMRVFDIHGRLVESLLEGEEHKAGVHALTWSVLKSRARSIAPGLYFCRLQASSLSDTRRIIVLR
jgi:uncharacterized protein YbaA (DUF1428 family)